MLDKRESEVAVEQKKVAVRRRQVCVLLIGLSPLTMLSLLFGSVVPQGGGGREALEKLDNLRQHVCPRKAHEVCSVGVLGRVRPISDLCMND